MLKYKKLLLSICSLFSLHVTAMNIIKPYDIFLRPQPPRCPWTFQAFGWVEAGLEARGWDFCGERTSVLRIWNCDQNGVAMLNECPLDSAAGQLRERLGNDDGRRGHFCVDGRLEPIGATFAARYFFPCDISLGFYLPIYSMKLDNVIWRDLTPIDDTVMRDNLTNNFAAIVKDFGCLDICGWRRTGLGDAMLVAEWQGEFKQRKPILKKVFVDARFGLSFPTGLQADEDKIFAFPFGNDGSWALMFGAGIDCVWTPYLRGGFDVQIDYVFGHTKERRIKTDLCQTDLLFLQKACCYKDYGIGQQFTLHGGLCNLWGFSCDVGYRFAKRGDDRIILDDTCFSDKIANTAESLRDWTSHQILLRADYDFGYWMCEDAFVTPIVSLYARLPFNGKAAALSPSFGVILTLDF